MTQGHGGERWGEEMKKKKHRLWMFERCLSSKPLVPRCPSLAPRVFSDTRGSNGTIKPGYTP